MALFISDEVTAKIAGDDHGNLSRADVEQCFLNHDGRFSFDNRPQHKTASGIPTIWFVGVTNHGVRLKITFCIEGNDMHLKSAYPATVGVCRLFEKSAGPTS